MSGPVWTEEELDALKAAEEKDEAWYRRGCSFFAAGCLPVGLSFLLPIVLFLD